MFLLFLILLCFIYSKNIFEGSWRFWEAEGKVKRFWIGDFLGGGLLWDLVVFVWGFLFHLVFSKAHSGT